MTNEHTTPDTSAEQLESILSAADRAAGPVAATPAAVRAGWLRTIAADLRSHQDELVPLAAAESHLPEAALAGELGRTAFQLEHFADAAEAGRLLDVVVEHADPDYPVAPRPDLVRARVAIGPVLVFTASNFPFAFSVAGNDTASALAAGCPVVVKAHPGHQQLSRRTADIVAGALSRAGAPEGTFGHLQGTDVGVAALKDPRIKACGFTGSVPGGRALFDIAVSRPDPIPFYGELGSLNPVFVTPAAAAGRAEKIGQEFAGSLTFRAGQLCTKPGILVAPSGSGVPGAVARALADAPAAVLLTDRITDGYVAGVRRLAGSPDAEVLAGGDSTRPAVIRLPASAVLNGSVGIHEVFGPAAVIVEYGSADQLPALATRLGPSLTATVQAEEGDQVAAELLPVISSLVGRVIWNGWPTGVSVTRALQHGGPYPATTAPVSGSIGADAALRWLRPVTYQNLPAELLPADVRAAVLAAAG